MRLPKLTLVMSTVLILTLGAVVMADKSLSVSKGINFVPTSARVALDPGSGNILIVFTELKANDNSYGRVHAVLLKAQPNGSYKVLKRRLVSPGSGWHGRAYAAYISQKGLFLVVWDTSDPSKGVAPSKIIGRWVKRTNGKPKGGQFDIVSDGKMNVFPVVYPLRDTPVTGTTTSPTGVKKEIGLITWTSYITDAVTPAGKFDTHGLFTARLDVNAVAERRDDRNLYPLIIDFGRQLAKKVEWGYASRYQVEGYEKYTIGIVVLGHEDIMYEGQWTTRGFQMSYAWNTETSRWQSVSMTYMPARSLTPSKAPLGRSDDRYDIVLSTQVHGKVENFYETIPLDNWNDSTGYTRRYSNVLSGKETNYGWVFPAKIDVKFAPPNDVYPAAKPALAHLVAAADDGWTYRRKIIQKGKTVGPLKKVFKHDNKIQALIGRPIFLANGAESAPAQKFNSIVVWQKKLTETKHQLIAHLFKIR